MSDLRGQADGLWILRSPESFRIGFTRPRQPEACSSPRTTASRGRRVSTIRRPCRSAMSPSIPTIPTPYAAAWERRRDGFGGGDPAICCGKGSGIYKSADGAKTWKKLTNGLPTGDLGRIGLAVADSNPGVVYAVVQTTTTAAREGAGGPE